MVLSPGSEELGAAIVADLGLNLIFLPIHFSEVLASVNDPGPEFFVEVCYIYNFFFFFSLIGYSLRKK